MVNITRSHPAGDWDSRARITKLPVFTSPPRNHPHRDTRSYPHDGNARMAQQLKEVTLALTMLYNPPLPRCIHCICHCSYSSISLPPPAWCEWCGLLFAQITAAVLRSNKSGQWQEFLNFGINIVKNAKYLEKSPSLTSASTF